MSRRELFDGFYFFWSAMGGAVVGMALLTSTISSGRAQSWNQTRLGAIVGAIFGGAAWLYFKYKQPKSALK